MPGVLEARREHWVPWNWRNHHVGAGTQILWKNDKYFFFFFLPFLRQGFAMWPWLSGTHSVDQAGLELTEIHLPLPLKC